MIGFSSLSTLLFIVSVDRVVAWVLPLVLKGNLAYPFAQADCRVNLSATYTVNIIFH